MISDYLPNHNSEHISFQCKNLIRLPWHVKTQTSHIGIKFISRIGIQIYFSPALIIVYTYVSREGILAKLDFRYFFTMPLHFSSFMYFESSNHILPKFIMFTSAPVKHFPLLIYIPHLLLTICCLYLLRARVTSYLSLYTLFLLVQYL